MLRIQRTEAFDVLVVGGGAAGIRAAIEAATSGLRVGIVTKGRLGYSGATFYAKTPGWGIAACLDTDAGDSPEYHLQDIREAGQGMENPELARILAEEAPARVRELEEHGVPLRPLDLIGCFSSRPRGAVALGMREIRDALLRQISRFGISVSENLYVFAVVLHGKRCCGVVAAGRQGLVAFRAGAVVLATGGATYAYPLGMGGGEATGDGYVMALNAGASLVNMEFVQFLFAFSRPVSKLLFTERLFAACPRLVNARGEEFLAGYLPEGWSVPDILTARSTHGPFSCTRPSRWVDIAVATEVREGRGFAGGGVWVDFPPLVFRDERWFVSTWMKWARERGVDFGQGAIIAPYAQAFNGGVVVRADGSTGVPGLFAAGEVAGGPHGADRLGGNMMAATQVFGRRAGQGAATFSRDAGVVPEQDFQRAVRVSLDEWPYRELINRPGVEPRTVVTKVREVMGRAAYVCRSEIELERGLSLVEELAADYDPRIWLVDGVAGWIGLTANSLVEVARVVLRACLARRESRGAHYRSDYPVRCDERYGRPLGLRKSQGRLDVFWDPWGH